MAQNQIDIGDQQKGDEPIEGEIHEEGHTTAARDFTQQAHRIVKESGGTTLYRGGGTPGARRRLHPPNGTREERKMEEEEENRREM